MDIDARKFKLLLCCLIDITGSIAQPGTIDATFNPGDIGYGAGDGPGNIVKSIVLQSDGNSKEYGTAYAQPQTTNTFTDIY